MASIAAPSADHGARSASRRLREFGGLLLLLPAPLGWLIFFYLIPLVVLLIHAFWSVDYLTIQRSFTLDNFRTLLATSSIPEFW